MPTRTKPRVAVIGAGLGGVAMAVRLKKAGLTEFTVFEASGGPGGVWWANTYPGCEVDVESAAYSYSFMRHDWSRTHAGQAEVQRYVESVLDAFGIRDHFRFNTAVTSATWDEARCLYRVDLAGSETAEFEVVISALGLLSNPRIPDWPGLDEFDGPVFHTSRFDHGVALAGKRVAIVGTGSTACQLGPAIAPIVGHLEVYQREPGWVMPKGARDLTDEERARLRTSTLARRRARFRSFRTAYKNLKGFQADSEQQKIIQGYGRHMLKKKVPDTDVRAALTPSYAWGCKRPIVADGYHEMFSRDNVTLVPRAVTAVTSTGIVTADGDERPADVLVLATGFQSTNFLGTMRVTGVDGKSLGEHWAGEPSAFLGMTVPGFPNLFMMYGPNTNGGWSVIVQLERQAGAIVRALRSTRRWGRVCVDTRPSVATRYDRWLQARVSSHLSAQSSGCTNYYTVGTGRNVTQWPGSHTLYLLVTRLLAPLGWIRRRPRPSAVALPERGASAAPDLATTERVLP
jgi:cation diffusion facilitator CzcD-associated flavoprotein CzcO